MMEYRIANIDDAFSLAEMRWDFKTEGKELDSSINKKDFLDQCVEFLEDGIKNGTWTHWVAVDVENIVSHISTNCIRKIPKPNCFFDQIGYLTNVYTKPEYRNKGIGSKLMYYVIKWAKEKELDTVIVWPSDRAINFYERKGFEGINDVMEMELR